jgi:hypothetical protein
VYKYFPSWTGSKFHDKSIVVAILDDTFSEEQIVKNLENIGCFQYDSQNRKNNEPYYEIRKSKISVNNIPSDLSSLKM